MKKFYLLTAIAILSFGIAGFAQNTYNATNSGNWSSGSTWDISGVPSPICTNCTITINGGVTVTLDASVFFTGSTVLNIGSGPGLAKLIIPLSPGTDFPSSYNIQLDAYSTSTIKLKSSNASIDGSAAGKFDGIFTVGELPSLPGHIGQQKIVGNAPSYFIDGNSAPFNAQAIKTLTGPVSINAQGTLPFTLSSFEAVLTQAGVNLNWTTSSEINSDHFGIEKSTDASHWQTIGIVAAKGFSSIAVNYSFTDESPSGGVSYYRLQMVDQDGKYKYSPIKVINGNVSKGLSVFPNPASNFVNVTFGSDIGAGATLRLINQFGQVLQLKRVSNAAGTTISLPVNNYPQGNYILQVTQEDGSKQTRKLLISR
jgi:hypothetical protein